MEVDKALEEVGGWRRWHSAMFIVLGISAFMPLCWQGLGIVFIGWEPPHECIVSNSSEMNENLVGESCSVRNNITNKTKPCDDGWVYHNMGYKTIVQKWNLVCKNNYKSELTQLVYQIGGLASLLIFSPLSDRLGRKWVHLCSHLALAVFGVGVAFSQEYHQFLIIKIILGMLTAINNSSGVTAILEFFDSKNRTIIAVAMEFQFILCNLVLCMLGFFVKDWMWLQIIISAASAIWIIHIWVLPESPSWLASVGRVKDAERVLHRIAKWNGLHVDKDRKFLKAEECELLIIDLNEKSKELEEINTELKEIKNSSLKLNGEKNEDLKRCEADDSFLFVLKDCLMIKYLFIGSLLWFSNSLVYYGLYLSTPNMGGNRFLNYAAMSLIELPAIFITIFVTKKIGRRYTLMFTQLLAGCLLAILPLIPSSTRNTSNLWYLVMFLIVVAKMSITASFAIVVFYTKELFPTSFRATGGGITQAFGFLGSALAPIASYLSKSHLFWMPNVIFGILSIIAGLMTLTLPETGGKALPQNIRDARRIAADSNKYKVAWEEA